MESDTAEPLSVLRVDGGASVSEFMMQFQADILGKPIDRPKMVETTAFGAAFLAGLASGVWTSPEEVAALRVSDRIFQPKMDPGEAKKLHATWRRAVQRAAQWAMEE